jgi:hypothetical protein
LLVAVAATGCNLAAIFPAPQLDYIEVEGDTVVVVGDTIHLRTAADPLASHVLVTGLQAGRVEIQVSARGNSATHVIVVH